MPPLRHWPLARVLITCVAWVFVSVAGWLYFNVEGDFAVDEGAGIGAVSIGINPAMLAIPIVPPMVLVLAWLFLRRPKSV